MASPNFRFWAIAWSMATWWRGSRPTPTSPPTLTGFFTFTSADGTASLKAAVEGTGTPDPSNSNLFLNFQYQVKFTGGSGQFSAARGEADIKGAAMFTSPSGGKATWKMKGQVLGINQGEEVTRLHISSL
jgi:hypothetical protein